MVAACLAVRSVLGFLSFVLLLPSSRSVFIRDLVVIILGVILESRSPGSVVIKKEENNRYWTETFQYDF